MLGTERMVVTMCRQYAMKSDAWPLAPQGNQIPLNSQPIRTMAWPSPAATKFRASVANLAS